MGLVGWPVYPEGGWSLRVGIRMAMNTPDDDAGTVDVPGAYLAHVLYERGTLCLS